MKFTDIYKINVNDHVEKKNNLSYLSWAYAVAELLKLDEAATWVYGEPVKWGETVMVNCTVTAFGRSRTSHLPVMDHRNKAIPNPDAFQVNTAMQRCLAKAIALHGLGLYIYAGEDIPQLDGPQAPITPSTGAGDAIDAGRKESLDRLGATITECFEAGQIKDAMDCLADITEADEKVYLWSTLDSKVRSSIKKAHNELKKAA